jgi:hypothetical protein
MKYLVLGVLIAMSTTIAGAEDSNKSGIKDEWKLLEVKPKDSDEIWYFRKNIGIANFKGKDAFKTLVYFTVSYVPIDSSGLPNKNDAEVLYKFEEEVIPKVEKEAYCVLVASVTKGGVKDHLFYVSDPKKFLESISKFKSSISQFSVSLEKVDDPDWKIYLDFPEGT